MRGVVGLEVTPVRAAVVHAQGGRRGLVVRCFAWFEGLSGIPELTARLASLRREQRLPKRANLVAWGGGERAQALASAVRRAGFDVEALLSPAQAMMAAFGGTNKLGSTSLDPPAAGATAYLALHADSGHLAVSIAGRLVLERPVRFTYPKLQSTDTRQRLLHRYTVLAGIVAVLEPAFRDVTRLHGRAVRQIVTCGSLPELRSLTLPLAEEFDVEVETLDGIYGVDATQLPKPADGFRDRAAALQLALTAAAVGTSPFDGTAFGGTNVRVGLATVAASLAALGWFTPGSRASARASLDAPTVPGVPTDGHTLPR